MPLDGHAYLVAQGWSGKGTGLREGAISRPLAIAQKKTLAGLGKDRDEAFPFWDHVFSAASTSIKIKIAASDDESEEDDEDTKTELSVLKRTKTGILCNRRPITGTLATTSGTATPDTDPPFSSVTDLSLISIAKREAAKRGLYSRFFRGPTLGPDDGFDDAKSEGAGAASTPYGGSAAPDSQGATGEGGVKGSNEERKRKLQDTDSIMEEREAKRRKRSKEKRREEKKEEKPKRKAEKYEAAEEEDNREERRKAREERKRAKEERRKAKEEKRARKLEATVKEVKLETAPSTDETPTKDRDEASGSFATNERAKNKRSKKKKEKTRNIEVDDASDANLDHSTKNRKIPLTENATIEDVAPQTLESCINADDVSLQLSEPKAKKKKRKKDRHS